MENVEFLLKIEEKNKREVLDRYERQIDKTEKQIYRLEGELKGFINELNETEHKIYEIQKVKFDSFKQEITKYDNIFKDLERKSENLNDQINDYLSREKSSYNNTFIIQEDMLSFKNEIYLNKKKIVDLKDYLVSIEKSYPKEFEFLLEDIRFEKELNQIRVLKSIFILNQSNTLLI